MVAVALVGGLVAVDGVSHLVANFPLGELIFLSELEKLLARCDDVWPSGCRSLARAFYRVGRTGFYVVLLSAPLLFLHAIIFDLTEIRG